MVCRDGKNRDSQQAEKEKENGKMENGQPPSAEIAVIQEGDEKPGGQKLAGSGWSQADPEQGNTNQTPKNVVCSAAAATFLLMKSSNPNSPVGDRSFACLVQVWGPLVFESRRFVELRQQTLWKQVISAESTGMGLFYTLNIFCIQACHTFHCLRTNYERCTSPLCSLTDRDCSSTSELQGCNWSIKETPNTPSQPWRTLSLSLAFWAFQSLAGSLTRRATE